MDRQWSTSSRTSGIYTSIDRGSRVFYRHQLAFADDSRVEKMSVRRQVRNLLLSGVRGMALASLEVGLSLIWVGLYIAETYYAKTPNWITALNWTFVACFTLLWLIHFAASPNRLRFLVSWYSIIDYVTIIPLFFSPLGASTFLRVISILRIFRILRILRLAPNERVKKFLEVSCIILCFTFVSSSLVLIVEPETFSTFWTSFYFVIVAIFTVGFGDITPATMFGQAIVILVVMTGVILLPLQALALSRIFSVKEDPVNGSYNPGHDSKHIVIFGNNFSASRLTEMITEFTIKYRFQRHIDLHLVIMQSSPPGPELRELAEAPIEGSPFIHVLHGSALNFDDLHRTSTKTADCAVTMYENDHDTCLVHMALKAYHRSITIYALLQRPEKNLLFRAVSPFKPNRGEVLPTIMSRLEISGALLARCIPTRGFATLICNLVRTRMQSMSAYEEEHAEYKRGAAYEIYFGVLPSSFCGSNFLDICLTIYTQHSALLIGLMTDGKHPLINPGSSYTINGGELAIFLAPDPSVTAVIKEMQNLPLLVQAPQKRSSKKKAREAAAAKKKQQQKEAQEAKEQKKRAAKAASKSAATSSGVRPILSSDSSTSTEVELLQLESAPRLAAAALEHQGSDSDGSVKTPPLARRNKNTDASSSGTGASGTTPSRRRKGEKDAEPKNRDEIIEDEDVDAVQTPSRRAAGRDERSPSKSRPKSPSEGRKRGGQSEMADVVSPSPARTQITWNFESERNKLIRYHEVAKRVDLLSKHYRVLDSPRTFRSAIVQRAPESGHIIFTGNAVDWVYYIAPLRSRSVSKCQPIIIVTTKPLTQKQWGSIAHFPEVYMMPGASLLKRRDIERLHVLSATHILITYGNTERANGTGTAGTSAFAPPPNAPNASSASLGNPNSNEPQHMEDLIEEEEESSFIGTDSTPPAIRDALLIYSWISRVCPNTRIVMDIRDEHDLRFLHKAERSQDAHIQMEIRSGVACATSSTVERLLSQTVYNPLVLDVVMQLIFGTRLASLPDEPQPRRKTPPPTSSSKGGSRRRNLESSNQDDDDEQDDDLEDEYDSSDSDEDFDQDLKPIIRLEQIPPSLKGASYRELFEDLVYDRDALPLGLYRSLPRPNKSRKQQYVYTCPAMDAALQPGDRVYVLFPSVPKS